MRDAVLMIEASAPAGTCLCQAPEAVSMYRPYSSATQRDRQALGLSCTSSSSLTCESRVRSAAHLLRSVSFSPCDFSFLSSAASGRGSGNGLLPCNDRHGKERSLLSASDGTVHKAGTPAADSATWATAASVAMAVGCVGQF